MLFDTHCHLDLPPLSGHLPEVIQRAAAAGVDRFICPGVAPSGWNRIASLAAAGQNIYPAFGIHPLHVDASSDDELDRLSGHLAGAVAAGEIGLDYSDRSVDRRRQQEIFRKQLRLAAAASLPVIIHCREAFADTLQIFREEAAGRIKGVMHAFSGSVETARTAVKYGLLIGIAGSSTWKGAARPQQVVREIPPEYLLLETDAPDLTPETCRGSSNEPAFLLEIALKTAELKGMDLAATARITTENAKRLFNV